MASHRLDWPNVICCTHRRTRGLHNAVTCIYTWTRNNALVLWRYIGCAAHVLARVRCWLPALHRRARLRLPVYTRRTAGTRTTAHTPAVRAIRITAHACARTAPRRAWFCLPCFVDMSLNIYAALYISRIRTRTPRCARAPPPRRAFCHAAYIPGYAARRCTTRTREL